jgi:hypothetical protein
MSHPVQAGLFGNDIELEERRAAVKRRLESVVLSEPLANPLLRVLSLGVGLQSVTLALMSVTGELPMLDAAIFSDTGREKRATYEYLDYLRPLLPFPISEVRRDGPDRQRMRATKNIGRRSAKYPSVDAARKDCSKRTKVRSRLTTR